MNRIIRIILKRAFSLILTMLIMSFVIFLLVELIPGDVAQMILGQSATEESVAALRAARGLDEPVFRRYMQWIGGVVSGNLGESIYMQGVPINSLPALAPSRALCSACFMRLRHVRSSLYFCWSDCWSQREEDYGFGHIIFRSGDDGASRIRIWCVSHHGIRG